jgi:hypothetical protein
MMNFVDVVGWKADESLDFGLVVRIRRVGSV